MKDHLRDLEIAVENCDVEAAKESARNALKAGIDPMVAITAAAAGIRRVGEKFQRGDAFLPHLVMAGDAMSGATKILQEALPKEKVKSSMHGAIVLGTVNGDIHDIGKNIVGGMLAGAGFEVRDIGKDVPADVFIDKAQEIDADIIAVSALMTITRPAQRELIEELKHRGLRDKFKVLIGGGTVTPEWSKEIGADGYGRDAMEGVRIAEQLLGK